jgi:hypothetical protein
MIFTRTTIISWYTALLCLLAGQILFALDLPMRATLWVPLGIWLHLVGLTLGWYGARHAACADDQEPPRRLQSLAIGAVLLLGAVLRFLWLDTFPFRVDGDAAGFAAAAADYLGPDPPSLIGTGWQSHTNLYFFLESLALRAFGRSVLGLRFLGALGGTLSILAIYALGRSLWGFWAGFWAALITAALPFHLVFSRTGTEVIHMTWLLPLALWSIRQGWQQSSWRWWLFGGAIIGWSQYFYPGARLIPILAVAQIGLLAIFPPEGSRGWRRGGWALLWTGLGLLAAYGPMIRYFVQRPEIYTARVGSVSILSSGWLEHELAQHPWWLVIGDQFRRAYLPFLFPVDGPPLWYIWPQYLEPFDAALFALGLILIWSGHETARWLKLLLAFYLGVGILLGGVLTIDTPMPSRYVIFLPAVTLSMGYALSGLLRQLRVRLSTPPRVVALGLVLGGIALYISSNVYVYLKHEAEASWSEDHTGQMATYAARYLREVPEQEFEIVFIQTDLMYYEASPVLRFLTDKPGLNVKKELTCNVLTNLLREPHTMIIAPRERIAELERMRQQVPSSELTVLHDAQNQPVVGILHVQLRGSEPLCRQ